METGMSMLQDEQPHQHVYMDEVEPREQPLMPPPQSLPMSQPPPPIHHTIFESKPKSTSLFELDKSMYILLIVAFVLGLFIGKNMQPVIIRAV